VDEHPNPGRARHAGCFAGQLTAAAVFVLGCVWIWFIVECVPVAFVEPTAVECDPLPTGTRVALTLLAVLIALLAGAAAGGIVTRLRPPQG